MTKINCPEWEEEVTFAREVMGYSFSEIIHEIIRTGDELDGEEVVAERHSQAMKKALGPKRDPNDHDAMVDTANLLLRGGQHLPTELATFVADVLEKKCLRPTRPGPDPYRDFPRNVVLSFAVEAVAQKFGIARYAHGNSGEKTAVNAVSKATKFTPNVVIADWTHHYCL